MQRWIRREWVTLLGCWAVWACSNGGGGEGPVEGVGASPEPDAGPSTSFDGGTTTPGDTATTGLALEPSRAEVVSDGTPRTARFVVRASFADGTTADVTSRATLTLSDPTLGTWSGGNLTTLGRAGSATLRATFEGLEATAELVVRVERTEEAASGPPLPGNPGAIFEGAPTDADRRPPTLVYPNAGVLLPPNLAGLELHYRPGTESDSLFRVRLSSPGFSVTVLTRCRPLGEGCLYELPPELWRTVALTAAGRDPLFVTVEATDDAGTYRTASSPLELAVAAAPAAGGLYYWSTSDRAILRVDFGTQGAPEQYFPPPGTEGGPCYGCHALSPDGQRMTLSQGGMWDGRLTLLEVGTRNQLVRASGALREQFQSWAPDSQRFVAVYGDDDPPSTELRIRDGENGQVIETVALGYEASHVDWSPQGDRIAFTRVTRSFTSQRPGRGGIAYVERTSSGWSEPRDLVAPVDGLNHVTPAYAPDGRFLAYAQSRCPPGQTYGSSCDGDADPSSRLFAISSDDGSPILLDRANAPGVEDTSEDLSNTFPKWAPFEDARFADGRGRVMWFTFSSRRRYGLRPPVGDNQLLWMVAVDPDAIARGEDGSHPAFALPFQDLRTSNHMAQWTREVVPTEPPPPDAGVSPDAGQCVPTGRVCTPGGVPCCGSLECTGVVSGQGVCRPRF